MEAIGPVWRLVEGCECVELCVRRLGVEYRLFHAFTTKCKCDFRAVTPTLHCRYVRYCTQSR